MLLRCDFVLWALECSSLSVVVVTLWLATGFGLKALVLWYGQHHFRTRRGSLFPGSLQDADCGSEGAGNVQCRQNSCGGTLHNVP